MKKYKLNNENESTTPSDSTIAKHKDFGRLFHEYENITERPKKPLYKNPKFFLFVIITCLIAYIIFTEISESDKSENNTEKVSK